VEQRGEVVMAMEIQEGVFSGQEGVSSGRTGMCAGREVLVGSTREPTPPVSARSLLVRPAFVGGIGYLVAAAALGAWWGLGVVAVALGGGLAWRTRAARRARERRQPEIVLSWRPSRLLEAVMAKVVLEEDGLREVVTWALVAAVATAVAVLVGAAVAAVAGHGLPLLVGVLVAVAAAWARRRARRSRPALPSRRW